MYKWFQRSVQTARFSSFSLFFSWYYFFFSLAFWLYSFIFSLLLVLLTQVRICNCYSYSSIKIPSLSSIVTLKIEKKNKLFCFVSLTELIYTNILLKVLEDSLYSLLKADPASITTLYMSNLFSKSKPSLELILIVKNFLS